MDQQYQLQNFYDNLPEPLGSTLLYLREYILKADPRMNESWKFGTPFFCIGKKMFCYFWFDKKRLDRPYLSFSEGYGIEHPLLEQGNRKRFKIFRFDPAEDLPMVALADIIRQGLALHHQKSLP